MMLHKFYMDKQGISRCRDEGMRVRVVKQGLQTSVPIWVPKWEHGFPIYRISVGSCEPI